MSGEPDVEASAPARSAGKIALRFAGVALLVAAVFIAWRAGVFDVLSFETLRERRGELTSFVAAHRILAFALFVAIYALATTLAIPGVLWITIAGGFLFGLVGGVVGTSIGATFGATILFLAARHLFANRMRKSAGGFLARFEEGFRRDAGAYLLSIRFIPVVPFFIANIAPAFLGVRPWLFVVTTFVGILPGVIAYTWIGAGLGAAFDAGREPNLALFARELVPALIALALLSLSPVLVRRLRAKRSSSSES